MYSSSVMINSESNTNASLNDIHNHNHISSSHSSVVDVSRSRYPYSIVWTPIPLLTWIIPIIGHMGIGTSAGIIRDFAGSYFVAQDEMAFGKPTKYWQLNVDKVVDGQSGWDDAVKHASDIYMHRMHNLICDNCHSHVALALNLMRYDGKSNLNMIKVWFLFTLHAKYNSLTGFLKTWIPFLIILTIVLLVIFLF